MEPYLEIKSGSSAEEPGDEVCELSYRAILSVFFLIQ